ncbi:MAG: hypothetical protein PVJ92_02725 [Candidatus Dependentiae bacterium]|jgi:hypothetical protein
MNQNGSQSCCYSTNRSLRTALVDELVCHLPYAIFAVVSSLVVMSVLCLLDGQVSAATAGKWHHLFHTLHFLHIVFAATGAVLAFRRYSQNLFGTLVIGSVVPAVFCTLSDAVMPYFGGRLAGIDMHFHWCFLDHFTTVLVFMMMGVLNGLVMSWHGNARQANYLVTSHAFHIFISALASTIFLVSQGFYHWEHHLGFVFLYLFFAVLLPCTFADVVVPTWAGLLAKGAGAKGRRA